MAKTCKQQRSKTDSKTAPCGLVSNGVMIITVYVQFIYGWIYKLFIICTLAQCLLSCCCLALYFPLTNEPLSFPHSSCIPFRIVGNHSYQTNTQRDVFGPGFPLSQPAVGTAKHSCRRFTHCFGQDNEHKLETGCDLCAIHPASFLFPTLES